MAPRAAALALALLLGRGLAGPVDESAMLQSDVQVHDMSEGSLALSEPPRGLALKTMMDLYSKTRQSPIGGMMPANVSMEDMMKLGNDVLAAFTNQTFVAAVMEAVQAIPNITNKINTDTRQNLANLATSVVNSSDAEVLGLVVGFFEQVNETESWAMGQLGRAWTKISGAFPFPEDLKMLPFNNSGSGGVGSGKLCAMGVQGTGSFLNVLKSNGSSVCNRFGTVLLNLTSARQTMEAYVIPTIEQWLPMISQLEPMISGLAPDATPAIMRAVNATAKVVPGVITDFDSTLASTVELMDSVATARLHCNFKSGSLRALPSVLMAAAAALALLLGS